MSRGKKNTDHVGVNIKDSLFVCHHCKRTMPFQMPMGCREFVILSGAFINIHKVCEAPKC